MTIVSALDPVVEVQSPSSFIVLVHGIWGRRSNWVPAGTVLADELQNKFPQSSIYRFMWSGKNKFIDRTRAVESLVNEIANFEPSNAVYLVAHSHGGSVAWEAARKIPRVRAVVALATPFLHIRSLPESKVPAGYLHSGPLYILPWR